MRTKESYATLRKPFWAPPSWLFGPVWTVLYVIIALSYGYVAYRAFAGVIPLWILSIFGLNLVCNLLYTPLQFALRNLWLATIDILLVLATLLIGMVYIYTYVPWVSIVNIPYLLWVGFATVLQCTITLLNNGRYPQA